MIRKKDSRNYWITEYKLETFYKPEASYSSYVIAETELTAKALLKLRGLDEKIISVKCVVTELNRLIKVSVLYKKRHLVECLHTLSFVGNIALNCGIIGHHDLLLDTGLIHDVIHELQFPEDFAFRKHLWLKLKEFDNLIDFLGY